MSRTELGVAQLRQILTYASGSATLILCLRVPGHEAYGELRIKARRSGGRIGMLVMPGPNCRHLFAAYAQDTTIEELVDRVAAEDWCKLEEYLSKCQIEYRGRSREQ